MRAIAYIPHNAQGAAKIRADAPVHHGNLPVPDLNTRYVKGETALPELMYGT